jgi:formylglycine-generating enzyme required for sulfatase activity
VNERAACSTVMATIFHRFLGGGKSETESGQARLALAAFGKHPGWNDYLGGGVDTGIGVDTEVLAYVKQALHGEGIRGQIDSGAWERLGPGKRLAGFDHTFLWFRANHVILGQLWSSTDGIRRPYPMVLCVAGQGVTPAFLLAKARPELERLRGACQSAITAEQVIAECHAAQDRLQNLSTAPQDSGPMPPVEARQRFLGSRSLGPDRLGFLRALHELEAAPAWLTNAGEVTPGVGASARTCHLRLPVASDLRHEGLMLWSAFLRCAVSEAVPLILISRNGVDWIDVVIGEPGADDFFWLQASLQASPLTTDIPFEVSSELKRRCEELEARFLGVEPARNEEPPGPPKAATPAPAQGQAEARESAAKPKKHKAALLAGGGAVLVAAVGLVVFYGKSPVSNSVGQPRPARPEAVAAVKPQPTASPAEDANAKRFAMAIDAARAALQRADYAEAALLADSARAIKTNDQVAIQLSAQAHEAVQARALAAQQETKYRAATNAAWLALQRKANREVTNQAGLALGLKPGDPGAKDLLARGLDGIRGEAEAAEREAKYEAARLVAWDALKAKRYQDLTNQAGLALRFKPADPEAINLMTRGQEGIQAEAVAAAGEQKYKDATNAAWLAFRSQDYASALAEAGKALSIHAEDTVTRQLKADAQARRDAAVAAKAKAETPSRTEMADGNLQPTKSVEALKASPAAVVRAGNVAQAQPPKQTVSATPAGTGTAAMTKPPFTNWVGMEFVWIPAVPGGGAYVGKYEVTRKQFFTVMDLPGKEGADDGLPVMAVEAGAAKDFCDRLSKKDGKHYSLPSKDEWLAASGVSPEKVAEAWDFLLKNDALDLEVTSLNRDRRASPERVGSRGSQASGLCDLFGNVREWVRVGNGGVESAGFSYNSTGGGSTSFLFLDPKPGWINAATGFRCILRE